jgi:hypothetical protein
MEKKNMLLKGRCLWLRSTFPLSDVFEVLFQENERGLGSPFRPEFLNFEGAQESIPRNQFLQAVNF